MTRKGHSRRADRALLAQSCWEARRWLWAQDEWQWTAGHFEYRDWGWDDRTRLLPVGPAGSLVLQFGVFHVAPTRPITTRDWAFLFVQAGFHHVFGDLTGRPEDLLNWSRACAGVVSSFVERRYPELSPPDWHLPWPPGLSLDRDELYQTLVDGQLDQNQIAVLDSRMLGGPGVPFLFPCGEGEGAEAWERLAAIRSAYLLARRAAQAQTLWAWAGRERGALDDALAEVLRVFPFLAALGAGFHREEDPLVCLAHGVTTAAVDESCRTIYFNPQFALSQAQREFVLAHELMHVAFRHLSRREWREPLFWNIACDFAVNAWLVEMDFGQCPDGALVDLRRRHQSAEAIYDDLVRDLKASRKLLPWGGRGDLLGPVTGDDEDEAFRRAVASGWGTTSESRRGFYPGTLVVELRALAHPEPPWDVQLARWFFDEFPSSEVERTWSRASRRQASTPEVPRAGRRRPDDEAAGTFGLLLDTSGSVPLKVLRRAVGAAGAYARDRGVARVRVVACDAEAHDLGWVETDDLLARIVVTGRGGTVLQPGVRAFDQAADFPPDAPLLVVTDGQCERHLWLGRDHAFLMPRGTVPRFDPWGPVFRLEVDG